MTMHSKLEIHWTGDVPGLSENRLSLGAFGRALPLLLKAYRRIASNLLRNSEDQHAKPAKRLFKRASWLDLQITTITQGSVGISAVGVLNVPPGQQRELLGTLVTRAGVELLDSIEAESKGQLRSSAVRKYLNALPEGVAEQRYCFTSNGVDKTVSVGTLHLPEEERELPHLVEADGTVVSVGFDPGSSFVSIETDGRTLRCDARAEDVERALELRRRPVTVVMVRESAERRKLLHIRPAGEPVEKLGAEELEYNLFGKWDGLLRRLAR